jgi:formylglycine-generating enzyme required for sulfatase activity
MCAMPDQPPDDPIGRLMQNIAALEEKQRNEGVDLSAEIQSLRALLGMIERPATTVNQSGGITAEADRIDIGGDVVGRDKDESHHETVTAQDGGVAISGSTVIGNIQISTPAVPALPADEALARYLQHVIDANSHLQLQGIRSSSGLVSIELEEIYITLTATERRTVKDEQQWIDEMSHLAPGEAQRLGWTMSDRPRATMQQVKVKVQEALRDHSRLVVLGDPGCGKTTLLKYLALTFARTQAGEGDFVKQRLELDEKRLPILLPLRDFARHLQERYKDSSTDGPKLLLNFLNTYFENQDIKLPERFFADRLQPGECVVLLDGVDEVADLPTRNRIARIVEKFTIAYPQNRYVVTSRIVGYTDAARLGEKYEVTTARDFTRDDITRFVTYWNHAIEVALAKGADTAHAQQQALLQTKALLKAIEGNERVRELAVNPLMLTVIALVQRYRAQLPERRAELYEEAIEVLLGHWDVAKGLSASMTIAGRELDAGDRRSLLEPIALWMMEQHVREIENEELRRQLGQRFYEMVGDWRTAGKAVNAFLQLINERSGLLAERGQGIYAFSHLTFQEHLAARAVSDKADYIYHTLSHLGDSWWREVVLLEAGYLSMQGKQRATALIQAIMDCVEEPEPYRNLVLAADCLRDVGQARVTGDLYSEVQRRLRREFETPLRRPEQDRERGKPTAQIDLPTLIRRRAAAAEALGRIESGAGTQPAFWRLPYGEPVWVVVHAGEFWMGDDDPQYEGRKPCHRVNLPTFKIAKVPITNAQYRFFVEAKNYALPEHWSDGKIPRGYESHPVVNVSWHDAMAYCRWLSEVTGKSIMLPSEAQWEKAARGDRDQRAYPWDAKWDETKSNNAELEINDSTPVGIFPEGISPCGCLDMSGNVGEWTISLWGKEDKPKFIYPYYARDGREDLQADDNYRRVLRGGAFFDDRDNTRCAARGRLWPDVRNWGNGFRVVVSLISR